jgi:thiamine thiazole synthase
MSIDDILITRTIVQGFFEKLLNYLETDVALVGGGPANLVCGTILGENGIKAVLIESKLAPGGGMWGGGMMFNEAVIQESALPLVEKLNINYSKKEENYYLVDTIESTSTLISSCVKAGTKIFNLMKVVDVMFRGNNEQKKINGLVLQWTPVEHMGLHVDPLTIRAKCIVDGSGHPAEVCAIVANKMKVQIDSKTGGVMGEMPMWAEMGEELTIQNTKEVFPGLFVTGMAANAVQGAPRMGPIFGGMLLSGQKVAQLILQKLKG